MKLRTMLSSFGVFSMLGVAALAQGCSGCDGDGADGDGGNGGSGAAGTGASASTSSESGSTSSGFAEASSSTGIEACAQQSAEATLVNKPVDIIFVIDNSGSMSGEITEVEKQINKNFANIIDSAVPAIDYRVVMVSRHGAASGNRVCIAEPLSGIPDADNDGRCDTVPAQPVNTAKFYHHSVDISSTNALCQLIRQYTTADQHLLQPNGYGAVLRPEAFKFFVVITDDQASCSFDGVSINDGNTVNGGTTAAANFEGALFARWPDVFGADEATRNYRFWSIVSLAPYNASAAKPYGDPHPPDASIAPILEGNAGRCTPDAVRPGTGYQALSILTGGYRYPTCGLEYTDIFTLMAQGVIEGAQVACEFAIPDPPPGETLDLNTVQVEFTSENTTQTFDQVANAGACADGKFYIAGDEIVLCPTTCDVVRAAPDADIDIKFGCEVTIQ